MKMLFFLLIPSLLFGQIKYVVTTYHVEINGVDYHGKLVGDSYERNLILTYTFDKYITANSIYNVDLTKAKKLKISHYVDGHKRTKNISGKIPKFKKKKSRREKKPKMP